MTHALTIELPDEVYQPLVDRANAEGQSPESIALNLVAMAIKPPPRGALLRKWKGALNSGIPDLAERHDHYLGQALADELKGNGSE
jgi:hypothetical protein